MHGEGHWFVRYVGSGRFFSFAVPKEEDGAAVTGIAPKAFLSCKTLRKLEIPDGVVRIGDWAFAHMQNLEELVFPFSGMECGKKVFLDCRRLRKITVRGCTAKNQGLPYFLASAVTVMEKGALLRPEFAGDERTHGEWMEQYDRALADYLEAPDEEGFEPVFIGWFHVEDMDEQIPKYVEGKRKDKIRLALQRLRYPDYLDETMEERLRGYLAGQMRERDVPAGKGGLLTDVVCDRDWEYCRQVVYLKILKESGCLDWEEIRLLMEGLGGTNPEMMRYLLECLDGERAGEDFFGGLEL